MTDLSTPQQGPERWQRRLRVAVILLMFLPCLGVSGPHPWDREVAKICVPMGVPRALVLAFIDIESKRNPLAINVAQNGSHQGFLPQDMTRARILLEDALEQTTTVGVGLLQITYRYHREAMTPNPQRFFDPDTNLRYGCQVLAQLLAQPGPLWKRIGRYHSASNLAHQQDYARRVLSRMMHHMKSQNGGRRK